MARKLFSYNRFIGLDTVTSPSNMSERFLAELDGAYVDFRGQIVKGPGFSHQSSTNYATNVTSQDNTDTHYNIKHYGPDDYVRYTYQTSPEVVNITNKAGTGVSAAFASAGGVPITPISLVNFDQKQFAFMAGHDPYHYNGTAFTTVSGFGTTNFSSLGSYPKGGHAVNILNRLVVAGIPGRETEIHVSEQDSFLNWRTNTSSGTTPNATDGAIIDVKNQFTSKDVIKGLAVLEGDKLVVFGQNETLVYLADTNINLWEIARDFRVPIGLFGRNTAVNVGTDVFFCSRFGIHSLKRAASGLTLETMTFTREIEDQFRASVEMIGAQPFREPQAVWDGEIGQYKVFFPFLTGGGTLTSTQYIFTYDPEAGRSGHKSFAKHTGSPSLNVKDTNIICASFYAREDNGFDTNSLLVGGARGYGFGRDPTVDTYMRVRTPLLSQGSPDTFKHYKRLIIRAVGTADFDVKIYDSETNLLQTTTVRPETDGFGTTTGISGDSTRPIDIPIPHRSKSISIEFVCTGIGNTNISGIGSLKILDFALVVDTK